MSSLKKKEYNLLVDKKVNLIRALKDVAEKVTLTEFIELYGHRYDEVMLGSFWYGVNKFEIDSVSYGGTDPN